MGEILEVQKILQDQQGLFGIRFVEEHYQIHILHSEIPQEEQNIVFSKSPALTRRIILSTNIAYVRSR